MLRTFIQLTSLTTTAIATFFWIRGAVRLTNRDVASLSVTTFNGFNPTTLSSMAAQKADSIISGFLLGLSFLLQTGNLLWPMKWVDFGIDGWGVLVSAVFSIVIVYICFWVSSFLRNIFVAKARSYMTESALIGERFNNPDLKDIRND